MKYAVSGLMIVSALIGVTLWSSSSAEMTRIPYEDVASVAAGKEIYGTNCASCHGAKLEGKLIGKYEALTDTSQRRHTMRLDTPGTTLTRCCSNSQNMDHSIWQALITNRLCLLMGGNFPTKRSGRCSHT